MEGEWVAWVAIGVIGAFFGLLFLCGIVQSIRGNPCGCDGFIHRCGL